MNLKIALKTTVALILLSVLFALINWDNFLATVHNARLEFLVAMLALWPLSMLLSSVKWNLILQGYGINENVKKTFLLYWVGSFFNNFLPSSVGGDSYKFLALNKSWPKNKAFIGSSIVLERLIGICVIIPFPLLIGWMFLGSNRNLDLVYWGYFGAVIIITASGIIVWLLAKRYSHYIISNAKLSIIQKIVFIGESFFSYRDRSGLFFAIIISTGLFFISAFAYQLCFRAFGEQIAFLHVLFILPIISVAGAVPISINGLGIKEGLSVFLFSIFGISLEVALAVALTARVLLIIATSTGGIAYLFVKPVKVPGNQG